MKFWPHFYKFCPIRIKFDVGNVHKTLPRQNQNSGSQIV
jgi:hypothetical protein